ncbi:nitrile hydratase subunit beta [Acuticoccus sp. MNP-M23]|uniref:nitrile hydratase subunit beta n=1 Tax=Acuticoccus sp. MNP-M23 TaxID=3072793 RepID=UPI0028150736|nr:nitrile hydratase subunit beta [Acuticoccus sp. MNP-M23]WMS41096.1 nitrile hydratase subunit beta [Acuticoccus sp. MNP-M23]
MNGPQDLGGAHGFGPVVPETDEPVFHAAWERSAMALSVLMGPAGLWSLDRSRFARESLPAADYYTFSYYEIWTAGLEQLVAEAGIAEGTATPPRRVLRAEDVRPAMDKGFSAERTGPAPRFAVGDAVRVKPMNPAHHTRAPRYCRGKVGRITRVHGVHVFPDTSAHNEGENPQPLYNVAFAAADLWGPDTTAANVHLDLFEPYLDAV